MHEPQPLNPGPPQPWTLNPRTDSARELILKLAKGVDGYVSRVNPDVYEDFTLSKFEGAPPRFPAPPGTNPNKKL